jgi:hypothetical protein
MAITAPRPSPADTRRRRLAALTLLVVGLAVPLAVPTAAAANPPLSVVGEQPCPKDEPDPEPDPAKNIIQCDGDVDLDDGGGAVPAPGAGLLSLPGR